MNQPNTFENTFVSIYNIQGQLILQLPVRQEKMDLDIAWLAKGVYVLELKNDLKKEVIRFVKE